MKKILITVLTAILLCFVFINVFASEIVDSGACGDDLTYTVDEDGVLTISGNGDIYNFEDLNRSEPWEEVPVDITSVIIEEGVTGIPAMVFQTFDNVPKLKSVVIGDTVEYIGEYAFEGNKNLSSVVLPQSLKSIGNSAFENCLQLRAISIPESTIEIGDRAFYNCKALKQITLPDNVVNIGEKAFSETGYFTKLSAWIDDGLYIGNHLITAKPEHSGTFKIKEGTVSIAPYAFQSCKKITDITIPGTVKVIGNKAFYYLSELKSVIVEEGVEEIGDEVFAYCNKLSSITLPSTITHIGEKAFSFTRFYSNSDNWFNDMFYVNDVLIIAKPAISGDVVIKEGTKAICSGAFWGCKNITSVTLPQGVTKIGNKAFMECSSLTTVTLPDTITSIGNEAFKSCHKLSQINLQEGLTTIGSNAFEECFKLTSINLPDTLTTIGSRAFLYCTALTEASVPSNVTQLGKGAFHYCTNLTTVAIEGKLKQIEDSTFDGCKNLKEIKLPDTITYIGAGAFVECSSLEAIEIPKSVTRIGVDAFYDCKKLKSLYISDLEAWFNVEFVTFESNPICVGGTTYLNNNPIVDLIIPESIKEIPLYHFYSSTCVESITIHKGIKTIQENAFKHCKNLKEVKILSPSTKISKNAFPTTITIYSKIGSNAEYYAYNNDITFKELKTGLENFQKSNTYSANQFMDSTEKDWYYNNVKSAYEYSLMLGTSSDKFSPSDNLTLAQVVTLAARLNSIYKDGEAKFVQGDVWYQVYIDYCIENGILTKDAYSDFNKSATRSDFVSIISKAIPSEEFDVINSFDAIYDVPSTHKNFNEIISFYRSGILVGSDEMRSFKPESNITRAETATIITRIIDKTLRVKIQ